MKKLLSGRGGISLILSIVFMACCIWCLYKKSEIDLIWYAMLTVFNLICFYGGYLTDKIERIENAGKEMAPNHKEARELVDKLFDKDYCAIPKLTLFHQLIALVDGKYPTREDEAKYRSER